MVRWRHHAIIIDLESHRSDDGVQHEDIEIEGEDVDLARVDKGEDSDIDK